MAVDLTTLKTLVAKFRKGSPNIAAAFDEVGKLLTKLDADLWAAVGDLSTRVKTLEDECCNPDPPPSEFASPLGFLDNHLPGQFPSSHIGDYGVIQSAGPAPAGFRGNNILYRTSITCGISTYNNVQAGECLANHWEMRDAAGNILYNTSVEAGAVLADPGIPAYQQRWAELTLQRLQQHGASGFWADDSAPTPYFIAGEKWPAKYPNKDAYANALLEFCKFQQTFFGGRDLTTGYNCLIPMDDNASQITAWVNRLGAANAADLITAEYQLARGTGGPPSGYLRRVGPEWFNNWDPWRNVHRVCNQNRIGFFPLNEDQGQAYCLGTFLLDWNENPLSSHSWRSGAGQGWVPFYDQVVALGRPTADPVKAGNVWTRQFEHGRVTVDPVNATAVIS